MRRIALAVVLGLLAVAPSADAGFVTPSGVPYISLGASDYERERRRVEASLSELSALRGVYDGRIAGARRALVSADEARDDARAALSRSTRAVSRARDGLESEQRRAESERATAMGAVRGRRRDAELSVRWAERVRKGFAVLLVGSVIGALALVWRVGWSQIRYVHVGVVLAIAVIEVAVVLGGDAIDDPSPPAELPRATLELARRADAPTGKPTAEAVRLERRLRLQTRRRATRSTAYRRSRGRYEEAERRLASASADRRRLLDDASEDRRRISELRVIAKRF